jgi:hypothetical protein
LVLLFGITVLLVDVELLGEFVLELVVENWLLLLGHEELVVEHIL